jgi:hypothetical protein
MDWPFVWEDWFSASGALAMAGWAALILLPRRPLLLTALRQGVVLVLALVYAGLILRYFFTVEGGFGSLAELRALFSSEPLLLAGWVHYLAFDLFIGGWIAARADAVGVSRLVQAPILLVTFLFGPIGLLLWWGAAAGPAIRARLVPSC